MVVYHVNHSRCPAQHKDGAVTESLTEIKKASCAGRSSTDAARFDGLLPAEATRAENVHTWHTNKLRMEALETWHMASVLF